MNKHNSLSSNWLSSHKWYVQVLGALIISRKRMSLHIIAVLTILSLLYCLWNLKACLLGVATIVVLMVLHIVRTLNPIYCLRKEESRITWSQISLLASLGGWLILVISQMDFQNSPALPTIVSVIGAVLSWIFQDTIKSVVAFFYLRANELLKIGDWIEVKSHGIDGIVKRISLTTVTIENWDTTTSAFPTYILHSEHFKNNQKMMEGKTEGRQMQKTFIIDTGWIHAISKEELTRLKGIMAAQNDRQEYFITHEAKVGMLNIQLYRQYLYHWLMHHPHVSQAPQLLVRWLEHTPEGLPLQVNAFITDSNLAPFEWQQSLIIEHIIEALAWFNLQLYQSASGYDASNSNIYLTQEPANYKKGQNNGKV